MSKTKKKTETRIGKASEDKTKTINPAASASTDGGENGLLSYLLQFRRGSKTIHKIVRKDGAIGIPLKLRTDLGWGYRTEVEMIELGHGRLLIQKHVSMCNCCGKPVLSKSDLTTALGNCVDCDSELFECIATGKLPNGESISAGYAGHSGSKIDYYYTKLCNFKNAANAPSDTNSGDTNAPKPGVRRIQK